METFNTIPLSYNLISEKSNLEILPPSKANEESKKSDEEISLAKKWGKTCLIVSSFIVSLQIASLLYILL